MGYRYPGDEQMAAIEVSPISGRKLANAAIRRAGRVGNPYALGPRRKPAGIGTLHCRGPGKAQINVAFLVAGPPRAVSAVIGFDDEAAAKQATSLIQKAAK